MINPSFFFRKCQDSGVVFIETIIVIAAILAAFVVVINPDILGIPGHIAQTNYTARSLVGYEQGLPAGVLDSSTGELSFNALEMFTSWNKFKQALVDDGYQDRTDICLFLIELSRGPTCSAATSTNQLWPPAEECGETFAAAPQAAAINHHNTSGSCRDFVWVWWSKGMTFDGYHMVKSTVIADPF